MASLHRVSKWLGVSFTILLGGYLLFDWVGHYMTEGVLQTETRAGMVLVALSSEPEVKEALRFECYPVSSRPASVSRLIASGRLAEIPSETEVNSPFPGDEPALRPVTIDQGRLKGRWGWACSNQFTLLHPMP